MQKFPKLRYPNDSETDGVLSGMVAVTEKLDGANFRFSWDTDEDCLVVGTRNHEYRADDENLPTAFEHAVTYVQRELDTDPAWRATFETGRWTFYGEAMHVHSLDYDDIDWQQPPKGSAHVPLDSSIPNVVLFDARKDGEWVDWDEFKEAVETGPFEHSRIIAEDNGERLQDRGDLDIPDESMFGGQPEGIVVRRFDGAVRAKKVSEDFREKNAISFESPSKAQTDAGQFVAAFVTESRIEKMAHKLVDRGEYDQLEMPMMEDLPREVLKDVMGEEAWNLLTSGGFEGVWDDDFKGEVRSKTSKKCARTLKALCQEFSSDSSST